MVFHDPEQDVGALGAFSFQSAPRRLYWREHGRKPAPAAVMVATGVAVLVMTRFAWRWMADPADWRDCG